MGAADRSREAADRKYRRRISEAIAELAHERKLKGAAADDLCRRAAIPRRDFDRLFPSLQAALRCAFAEGFDCLFEPVHAAGAAAPSWLEGLASALDALLQAAAEHPRLAELCLSYSLVAPENSAGHDYRAAVDEVSALVRVARVHAEAEARQTSNVPVLAEEFLAHGILSRAGQIAERDGQAAPRGRRGDLLMLVLMTFYGTADAARMCREIED